MSRDRDIALRIALLALSSLIFGLAGMSRTPLFDVDEGAFSEATREMLQSGDFGFTFLNGIPRFDKPILVYWLQAIAMSLLGQDEVGARFVSLLAGLASAWTAARFVSRWSERSEAPLIVFALYGTCFGPLVMRHAATADALLNLWLCLCTCSLIESIRLRQLEQDSVTHLKSAQNHLRIAWMACALAVLTKGLIGLIAPACVVAGLCIAQRNLRALRWSFSDPLAWLAWTVLALPWYAYAYWRFSRDFIDGLFGKHHFGRSLQAMEGHSGSWFYTLGMLFVLSLPFTPLLIASLWQRYKEKSLDVQSLGLLSHALGMLAIFTVVATKLPHYAMYTLLPLLTLISLQPAVSKKVWLSCVLLGFGFVMFVGVLHPVLAYAIDQPTTNPFYRALIAYGLEHSAWQTADIAWLAVAFSAIGLAMLTPKAIDRWLCMALGLQGTVCLLMLPAIGQMLQSPVKELAKLAGQHPTVSFQLRAPSFSFYRNQITEERLPAAGEWVVLRSKDFPQLHRAMSPQTQWSMVGAAGPLLLLQRQASALSSASKAGLP